MIADKIYIIYYYASLKIGANHIIFITHKVREYPYPYLAEVRPLAVSCAASPSSGIYVNLINLFCFHKYYGLCKRDKE